MALQPKELDSPNKSGNDELGRFSVEKDKRATIKLYSSKGGDNMKRWCHVILLLLVLMALVALNHDNLFASGEDAFHGGDIIYTKPLKAVLFSHKVHAEEMGFSCEACHEGIFEMSALSVQEKEDFTMDSLYKGKYCGACHNGSMAFSSDSQCARCHIGVKGYKRLSQSETEQKTHGED